MKFNQYYLVINCIVAKDLAIYELFEIFWEMSAIFLKELIALSWMTKNTTKSPHGDKFQILMEISLPKKS